MFHNVSVPQFKPLNIAGQAMQSNTLVSRTFFEMDAVERKSLQSLSLPLISGLFCPLCLNRKKSQPDWWPPQAASLATVNCSIFNGFTTPCEMARLRVEANSQHAPVGAVH
jgi:hypothetical protein